jgi:hypothetical protein
MHSYVLLDYPSAPPTRLHTNKGGPYQVISFTGNDYVIRDLVRMKDRTVHISRLTPFEFDPELIDPRLIANKENASYDVLKIHAHRGNTARKGTLEFLTE